MTMKTNVYNSTQSNNVLLEAKRLMWFSMFLSNCDAYVPVN